MAARENRRVDAREQLGIAYEALSRIGVEGFAERAWNELRATWATAPKRTAESRPALTAQEAQTAFEICRSRGLTCSLNSL
jgi:hypothetical protein